MMFDIRDLTAFQPIRIKGRLSPLSFKGGSGEVKETAEQRALADIMTERFAFYRDNYGAAEDEYFDSVSRYKDPTVSDYAADLSSTAAVDTFSDILGGTQSQLTSAGVDPSSGAFQGAIRDVADAGGAVTASNVSRGRTAVNDQYVQGLTNIAAIGNGKATDAISSFGDIAQQSGERAADRAVDSHNNRSANVHTGAQIAGAGTRALLEQ